LLYTLSEDQPLIKQASVDQIGTNPDGYPIYALNRELALELTNSDRTAEAISASIGLAKAFDNGFDFSVGYAYTDSEDVNPMTSSVASSNYWNRAFFDPNEDVASTSNYNIEHRFTFMARYRRDLADRFPLTVSLYGQANSGQPYSYAILMIQTCCTWISGTTFSSRVNSAISIPPPGGARWIFM
jgi:hypothetical protein